MQETTSYGLRLPLAVRVDRFWMGRIEYVLSNLFYLFFSAQILSPSVGSTTLYLENVVALLNPMFLRWLADKSQDKRVLVVALPIVLYAMMGDIVVVMKIGVFVISISYIIYSRERGHFFLYRYVAISVLFAVIQFSLLFVNPTLAFAFGPTSIATFVWGDYATGTFTNFYSIFAFTRVAGLSREGGFLATFILNCILVYLIDRRAGRYRNGWVIFALLVGFVLSFSKMSLLILPVLLIFRYRRWVNHVPYLAIAVIYSVFFIVLSVHNLEFLSEPDNGTYLQRFGGFATLTDLSADQLIFGTEKLSVVNSDFVRAELSLPFDTFDYFAGFGGYIVTHGLLGAGLALFLLWLFGITPAGLLLLLLLTMNVDIATNQNFVTLSYFLVLTEMSVNRRLLPKASFNPSLSV